MAANYTCGMEIVLDHGGLTAATVAARLQEEFQQRNVSSADFFLDRRPIDNWQLSRQVGISKDFCLTSQYMEVRLMSVANFGIDIIYITSIPGTAISMSDWAASFFGNFFIMAYVFDVNYQYWQNAQDPLQYSARGKDYSALPMISNGMQPPLEQMIIDTSRNPGRRILCEGYIEAVGATMWLGEVFWSRTHADRNALDQKHLTSPAPNITSLSMRPSSFCSAEGEDGALQNELRTALFNRSWNSHTRNERSRLDS